jgi:hypothetical protein
MTVTAPKPLPAGRLADFERRREHHIGGIFLTRADIERRHPVRTSSLFFGLAGVRIVDSGGVKMLASGRGENPTFAGVKRRMFDDLAPCYFNIGIDGLVGPNGRSVDDVPTHEIEAIEVYQGGASMPRELMLSRQDGYCGLVMIWTRSR